MTNAMKKQTKKFIAGLVLSILIPAFIGGTFLLTSEQDTVAKQTMEQVQLKASDQEIDMDKAFSIVP